jgi:hypothetical protein
MTADRLGNADGATISKIIRALKREAVIDCSVFSFRFPLIFGAEKFGKFKL